MAIQRSGERGGESFFQTAEIATGLPVVDPVYESLVKEAKHWSDTTVPVPLALDRDTLGFLPNQIREAVFGHSVVVPVEGSETGHFGPLFGPEVVAANIDPVVNGSEGLGIGMRQAVMRRVEKAAERFVVLAVEERRLTGLLGVLKQTGRNAVFDPRSERSVNEGTIKGGLESLGNSYQTAWLDFYEQVTGQKVVRGPKSTETQRRTSNRLGANVEYQPVVDASHVAQIQPEVLEEYRRLGKLTKTGLAGTSVLIAMSAACSAASAVSSPTPMQFNQPRVETQPTKQVIDQVEPMKVSPTEVPTVAKAVIPTEVATTAAKPTVVVSETTATPEQAAVYENNTIVSIKLPASEVPEVMTNTVRQIGSDRYAVKVDLNGHETTFFFVDSTGKGKNIPDLSVQQFLVLMDGSGKQRLMPLFMQTDPRWGDTTFPDGSHFESFGCGESSVASLASLFGDKLTTPSDMLQTSYFNEHKGGGTIPKNYLDFLTNNGITYERLSGEKAVVNAVNNGEVVMIGGYLDEHWWGMHAGEPTSIVSHYFLVIPTKDGPMVWDPLFGLLPKGDLDSLDWAKWEGGTPMVLGITPP